MNDDVTHALRYGGVEVARGSVDRIWSSLSIGKQCASKRCAEAKQVLDGCGEKNEVAL
jgi:hypothetical protein